MNYREALKARIAAATFRALEPYTYSPHGHHEDDHAVSLDGRTALNPMPVALAMEVAAALSFAQSSRTDVDVLLAQLERAETALEKAGCFDCAVGDRQHPVRPSCEAHEALASLRAVLNAEISEGK